MNYPELIWRLIEMLLQNENNKCKQYDKVENNSQQNVKKLNETV